MADHQPMPGLRRHHFEVTEVDLSRAGERFHRAYVEGLAAGEDPHVLLAAMAYTLGIEYALTGCVPSVDTALRESLPTFIVGYRTGRCADAH